MLGVRRRHRWMLASADWTLRSKGRCLLNARSQERECHENSAFRLRIAASGYAGADRWEVRAISLSTWREALQPGRRLRDFWVADSAERPNANLDVSLRPASINRILWPLVGILIAGNIVSQLTDATDYMGRAAVQSIFDLTLESSFPTWLSALLFLLSALLILVIGRYAVDVSPSRAWAWKLVSIMLVIFSIDEVAGLHETMNGVVREGLGVGGILFYAWLIPALLILVVLGLVLLPWLIELPLLLRRTIIAAGVVFFVGTVVLELVGGYLASSGLRYDSAWFVTASVEESFELVGVAVLFTGLVRHTAASVPALGLDLRNR